MAYIPTNIDNSPTTNVTIKQSVDIINSNFAALPTEFDTKVDKVAGKQLSTEDYTTTEKNKLAGIEAGAQVNIVTSVDGGTGDVVLDYTPNNIINSSNATVGLYAGSQRLDWTKGITAFTGALVFEITGIYGISTMVGRMNITVSEASKPDRVFLVEGRWNGGISNWDEGRCIELTEDTTEQLPIRFSLDTVAQKVYIIIGDTTSTWNNLRVKIDDVVANWNETLNLSFLIATISDFTGITHAYDFLPTRYEKFVKRTITASAPTVNDDNTLGYSIWSGWIDATLNDIYMCASAATGAAVWHKLNT